MDTRKPLPYAIFSAKKDFSRSRARREIGRRGLKDAKREWVKEPTCGLQSWEGPLSRSTSNSCPELGSSIVTIYQWACFSTLND